VVSERRAETEGRVDDLNITTEPDCHVTIYGKPITIYFKSFVTIWRKPTECLLNPGKLHYKHSHLQHVKTNYSSAGSEPIVHTWLHPSTTDHSGRAVIHIHPQYRLLE
jgi:hypothetical protein